MGSDSSLRKVLDRDRTYLERIEKTYKEGGWAERQISAMGGDASYLADVRQAIDDLYRALDEADYGARSHVSQESTDHSQINQTNEVANIMRLAGITPKE